MPKENRPKQAAAQEPKTATPPEPLTEDEENLKALIATYSKYVHEETDNILQEYRDKPENKPSKAQEAMARIKRCFKEWLEIRFDFHRQRGEFYRLVTSEGNALMARCDALDKAIDEVDCQFAGQEGVERMVDFFMWLKEQVREAKSAIKKATPQVAAK